MLTLSQGLPAQWSKLLTSSAITKEEAARHPEAVLDVLQFYTQQQLGAGGTDYQQPLMPTLPGTSRSASSAATRFEGVGLAGQQQQQREKERIQPAPQPVVTRHAPRQPSEPRAEVSDYLESRH